MSPIILSPYRYASAGGGGNPSGFLFYRTITIDHTKCGASDTSNVRVPVVLSGQTFLKTVANGGKVQSASGYDIGFYSDSALTTKLKWEVEHWDGSTGDLIAWVQVAAVTHSVDTVIYLAYDSTIIVTDQSDKTGTWGAGALSVLHLGDGSSLSVADSSVTNEHWNTNGPPTATTGKIRGGMLVVNDLIFSDSNMPSTGWTNLTGRVWFNPSTVAGAEHGIFSHGAATSPSFLIQINGSTLKFYADGTYREFSQTLSVGTWYLLAITLSISGGVSTWKFYKNGSLLSTYTGGASPANFGATNNVLDVGNGYNGPADGTYDEPRLLLETYSDDKILTEYNAENNPSTFTTLGAETPA